MRAQETHRRHSTGMAADTAALFIKGGARLVWPHSPAQEADRDVQKRIATAKRRRAERIARVSRQRNRR